MAADGLGMLSSSISAASHEGGAAPRAEELLSFALENTQAPSVFWVFLQ